MAAPNNVRNELGRNLASAQYPVENKRQEQNQI